MNRDCNNLDAYLAGDLSVDEAAHFERHLPGCDACRDAIDQQRWIDDMLQSPIRLQLEPVPLDLVELPRTLTSSRRQRVRLAACGFAAAAAVLVAFGWWELNRQADSGTNRAADPMVAVVNTPAQIAAPPTARFIGGADVIAVPIESHHPDVTIVRIYPTYRPQRDNDAVTAQSNTAIDPNLYGYSNGG